MEVGNPINANVGEQIDAPQSLTAAVLEQLRESGSDVRGTARYQRIARAFRIVIDAGVLAPGTVLPPEPELADALGVSRRTLRHAFDELARAGLLVRRRGIGTAIARPGPEHPLGKLSTFLRTLVFDGRPPESRVVGARLTIDEAAARFLQAEPATLLYELTRLFIVDGEPIVIETILLPREIGEGFADQFLASAVIDELVERLAGVAVDRGEETLRLTSLSRTEAALLQAPLRSAAVFIERYAYAGSRPIEVRRSVVRGDHARFRISLQAE